MEVLSSQVTSLCVELTKLKSTDQGTHSFQELQPGGEVNINPLFIGCGGPE